MKKESENKFKLIDYLILLFILIIAFSLRVYKINNPLADWESSQQVNTAAVARNFVDNGLDLFHPKADDLSNLQSGIENPNGYRMAEFPIYSAIFASFYKYLPLLSLEAYGRLTTALFSLIIIFTIYFLLLKENTRFSAVIGALVYSVFPYFVFFSRVILPETTAVGLIFLSLFFLYLFLKGKNKTLGIINLIISATLFSLGLLTKTTVIFYLIAAVYLFYKKYGFALYKKILPYVFVAIAFIPWLTWKYYFQSYPAGIPLSTWLISTRWFKDLQTIFFYRINNLILGGYLSVLFILGVLSKNKRYLFSSMLVSSLLYLFIFLGGNVRYGYYQTIILPSLVIFVALGTNFFYKNYKSFIFPPLTAFIVVLIFISSFIASYSAVQNYYNYSSDLVSISNVIKDLTYKNDKIITETGGDATLLYLADRSGSPTIFKDLSELKKDGYSYFVTSDFKTKNDLEKRGKFNLIFTNEKFAIFKL